jgi:uncharacterized protein YacL (UPF0231 family)
MPLLLLYISILLVLFLFLKSSRRKVILIDELRIDSLKVEKLKVENLSKIKLSEQELELTEDEESLEFQQEELQVDDDDSTLSHDNETILEKGVEALDEDTIAFNTGSSTPCNHDEIIQIENIFKPPSQPDLNVYLQSFIIGKMMLKMETLFDQSTDFTASTLRKIVPTRMITILKKYL